MRSWSRQYRSAIFWSDTTQRRQARESLERELVRLGRSPYTDIEQAGTFWPAEDYHQKYNLRQDKLLASELSRAWPRGDDFRSSTAAARINGYLAGWGSVEGLGRDMPGLGLSPAGEARLRGLVGRPGALQAGAACSVGAGSR